MKQAVPRGREFQVTGGFKQHLDMPLAQVVPTSLHGVMGTDNLHEPSQDRGLWRYEKQWVQENKCSINITAITGGDTNKMPLSPSGVFPLFCWTRTYFFAFASTAHPSQLDSWRGSLLTTPSEMIFQENSKKCYSFEMRTWPLVHHSILIHGLLAIAHLLLEIN